MKDNFIVTIDGPAASGKSTVAKKVAELLNINYIDSGAMFRAITLFMLDNNIDIMDQSKVVENLNKLSLNMIDNKLFLNDTEVGDRIRENRINQNVSHIAVIKEVREYLLNFQRNLGKDISIIMDGRDIGSKVFPNAKYKFYLTATPEERANRRFDELKDKDSNISLDQILREIKERDHIDTTRKLNPLVCPKDAIKIDTTNKDIDNIVNLIVENIVE